jgi:excisionase family DNA binding protein
MNALRHQLAQQAAVAVVSRITFSKREAADALGVSVDFFEQHVMSELRVIRRGRLVLVPVDELRRWVEKNAALTVTRRRASEPSTESRSRDDRFIR